MDSFYVGEIVWGKVKGFSWWPGEVKLVLMLIDNRS